VLVSICANVYIYSADEFVRRCIIYIYILYIIQVQMSSCDDGMLDHSPGAAYPTNRAVQPRFVGKEPSGISISIRL
jgi:hypothetical protein